MGCPSARAHQQRDGGCHEGAQEYSPDRHALTVAPRRGQNVIVAELTPGTEFAGCRIEAIRGRGGMGVVYRAREISLDRAVAIKLINDDLAGDAQAIRRFEREARLMASIDHPNVIPVYGAGEEDGHLYLVMRYVDGTDLQALLRSRREARARAGGADHRPGRSRARCRPQAGPGASRHQAVQRPAQ